MDELPRPEGQELVVSPEQATRIRQLRVEEELSYRGVARRYAEDWYREKSLPAWWGDPANQYIGTLLCMAAAEHFGEDIASDLWQGPAAQPVADEGISTEP